MANTKTSPAPSISSSKPTKAPNNQKPKSDELPATTPVSELKELVFSKTALEHYRLAKSFLPSFKVSSKSKTLSNGSWARPFRFEPDFQEPLVSKDKDNDPRSSLYKELNLNSAISSLLNAATVQPSFILAYIKAAILSQEANGCYYSSIQYFKQALSLSELMPQPQINWCNYRIGLAYFIYGQRTMSSTLVDFAIDYLSVCLVKDYKGYHYDALLYRGICYLYTNNITSAHQDLDALALLVPSMHSLVVKVKQDFELNPVFVVSSKELVHN